MASARFTQPPVREVSLTVLWDPIDGLLAAHVGDLIGTLRQTYPVVTEKTAMIPWTEIRVPGIQILGDDKVLPYSWWLSSADNNLLVRVQFDRLVLSWMSTPEGESYREYPALRNELARVMEITAGWINEKVAVDAYERIRRVQIDYTNEIDSMAPIDLLCGILTDWSGERGQQLPAIAPVVNATWFIDIDPEYPIKETTVQVESDGLQGSVLTIVSTRDLEQGQHYLEGLDRVHERSHEVFLSITSDQLQEKWGRRR